MYKAIIAVSAKLFKEEDGKIVPVDKSSYQHEKGDATSEVTIDKLGKEKVLANKKRLLRVRVSLLHNLITYLFILNKLVG